MNYILENIYKSINFNFSLHFKFNCLKLFFIILIGHLKVSILILNLIFAEFNLKIIIIKREENFIMNKILQRVMHIVMIFIQVFNLNFLRNLYLKFDLCIREN